MLSTSQPQLLCGACDWPLNSYLATNGRHSGEGKEDKQQARGLGGLGEEQAVRKTTQCLWSQGLKPSPRRDGHLHGERS